MKRGFGQRVRTLYPPIPPFVVQGKQPSATASGGLAGLIQSVQHEVLGITFWFDPAPHRKSDSVSIRFSGQRVGVIGPLQRGDRFERDEKVEGVVGGSGPISLTARVFGINPGQWAVTAKVLNPNPGARAGPRRTIKASVAEAAYPAAWSWRKWELSKGSAAPVKTTLLPFIRVPGVIPMFWSAMAVLGLVVSVASQDLLISRAHLKIDNALTFSLFAIGLGLVGAKVWFVVLRRRERRVEGWCIQGFFVGIAVTAAAGFVGFHFPVGAFLDASTPGVFFGMAIGRVGCFFGGCCAGRPTGSRWGLWSVLDQRVGMRRVPTQMLEALLALGIGLMALVAVLSHGPLSGAIFVAGLAFYTLVRQGILRLRGGPPKSPRVAQFTAVTAAFVLAADLLFVTVGPALPVG